NDTVLARPGVAAVVDDARSALQLDPARYDVISSEPSNIWLAGVATLYTPEFYRIVRRRLADDGVFCQWVQLYQVPVPVVAGVVRNIRTVFPHVEVWFSSPGDVLIIGSLKPLTYDAAWLARLVGPGGALSGLAREYLAVDAPDQYFGHPRPGVMSKRRGASAPTIPSGRSTLRPSASGPATPRSPTPPSRGSSRGARTPRCSRGSSPRSGGRRSVREACSRGPSPGGRIARRHGRRSPPWPRGTNSGGRPQPWRGLRSRGRRAPCATPIPDRGGGRRWPAQWTPPRMRRRTAW